MTKKQIVRTIIFLVILMIVLGYLNDVFSYPSGKDGDGVKERYNSFYKQPDKTIDGIYIGASGVDRYWVAPQAYHDYGETVFALSSGLQPLAFTKYLMKESMKTQSPSLFILDLRSVTKSADDMTEGLIRKVTDNMKFSFNRIATIKGLLDYASKGDNNVDQNDELSYYLSLINYHSKWDGEITLKDLLNPNPSIDVMGFAAHTDIIYNIKPQELPKPSKNMKAIPKETETILIDLLDYCDSLKGKIDILFVVSPHQEEQEIYEQINYAMDLVEERGYDILNFNTQEMYDLVGLDFKTDFYDSHHVNLVGAQKYTSYLAQYLRKYYSIPDRRGDKNYNNWEEAYKNLQEITEEGREELNKEIMEIQKKTGP